MEVESVSNTHQAGHEVSVRSDQLEAQFPIVDVSAPHAHSACGTENRTREALRMSWTKPLNKCATASELTIDMKP